MLDKRKWPLVSVVVPVYGTEKYVEKCLDSILNQTYQNLKSDVPLCHTISGAGDVSMPAGLAFHGLWLYACSFVSGDWYLVIFACAGQIYTLYLGENDG